VRPEFGFVADDLTGASDVLAQAHRHGLEAALVIGDGPLPTDADLVGIAGPARSLGGAQSDALVRRDLARLAAAEVEVMVYKVCSTFDSAPHLGSIGRGIDLLHERHPAHGPIAVAPAQPAFGRYTAFSDHYAAHGGVIHRLDRHPVMACHPSTPMHEADLRRVLAEQLAGGADAVGHLHLPAYADGTFISRWQERRGQRGLSAFVVDAVDEEHMDQIAAALRQDAHPDRPALVVGSGGIMAALARAVPGAGARTPSTPRPRGPVLAVSASASSVTDTQIEDAVAHGWTEVAVPASLLTDPDTAQEAALSGEVRDALGAGHDVVVHTTRGAGDSRYRAGTDLVDAAHVGRLLGTLAG
jgi:uncharacterized protein YgbK (DUF1537 family)